MCHVPVWSIIEECNFEVVDRSVAFASRPKKVDPIRPDEDQYWRMAWENRGLVGNIIKKHFLWVLDRSTTLDYDDLYQIGLMGLHRAATRFDPARGHALSTYSYAWIRQYITRAFQIIGFRFVRIPVHQWLKLAEVRRKFGDMDELELRERGIISAPEKDSLRVDRMNNAGLSLDQPVAEEASATYADFVLAHEYDGDLYDQLQSADVETLVEQALDKMEPREKEIIERRFGMNGFDPHTLEQVSGHVGLTRERIRQLEQQTIKRLARYFRLNTYLFKELRP